MVAASPSVGAADTVVGEVATMAIDQVSVTASDITGIVRESRLDILPIDRTTVENTMVTAISITITDTTITDTTITDTGTAGNQFKNEVSSYGTSHLVRPFFVEAPHTHVMANHIYLGYDFFEDDE